MSASKPSSAALESASLTLWNAHDAAGLCTRTRPMDRIEVPSGLLHKTHRTFGMVAPSLVGVTNPLDTLACLTLPIPGLSSAVHGCRAVLRSSPRIGASADGHRTGRQHEPSFQRLNALRLADRHPRPKRAFVYPEGQGPWTISAEGDAGPRNAGRCDDYGHEPCSRIGASPRRQTRLWTYMVGKVSGSNDREVLILGAGFSRAVSSRLPLANDLGNMVRDRLSRSEPTLFDNVPEFSATYPFEVWLSLLAEEQPHLQEAENLTNAARFAKLKNTIAEVLAAAQEEALAGEPPSWFYDLLLLLHYRRNNVITLNYDTIVEVGVTSLLGGPQMEVDVDDLLGGQPPLAVPSPARWQFQQTMRLLKLHGSLDWWWVPGDLSGATLVREEVRSVFGRRVPIDDEQRRRAIPGREPFIIPPLATKSRYYRNPLTRQLWRDAFEALAEARRITILGYSLPQVDIVMSGMLGTVLRTEGVTVEVVDPEPDAICKRIEALGGPTEASGRLSVVHGDCCVEVYVQQLRDRASAQAILKLKDLVLPEGRSYPDPVAVTWRHRGRSVLRGIRTIERSAGNTVVLICEGDPAFNVATGAAVSAAEVVRALQDARRLLARTNDGHEATVIAYATDNFENANAQHLLRVIAAGRMPENVAD
jgi:hypothetical protein